MLDRIGVHRKDERPPTDADLKHVTVLPPQLPYIVEEAEGANAVDERKQPGAGWLPGKSLSLVSMCR